MLKSIKKFIPQLILLTIVMSISAALMIFINVSIRDIIDANKDGLTDKYYYQVLIIFCFILVSFPVSILFNYLKSLFFKLSLSRMKRKYIQGVFKKNINEFQKDNNSIYVSALTNDYNQIETNFIEPILDLINSIVFFTAGVIMFSIVDPIILFIALGLMVINLIISIFSAKPLNKHNKERSQLFGSYTSYIKEVLSAFHIIKTNNLDEKVRNDYVKKSETIQQKGYVIDRIKTIFFAIQNANFNFIFMGLILVVSFMSIKGDITLGAVVLIIQAAQNIIWPIHNFSESLPKLFSVKSIFKRIEDSLENKNKYEETIDFEGFNNSINLNNLTFGYEDGIVLEDVNINFNKGGKYLIIGPSGGGKSTILKMLRKYFNPTDGEILIDGVPLKDIKKEQYFAQIANIEQNVFLFEDTLRNNLTLYKEYSEEKVNDAIKQAGLTDFVNGLSEGLETMIYDNGKNISGGERSRVAIARGLLNNAQIIFLDEAFANLDATKAKEIEESILALKDVTIINVSHVVFKEHRNLYDNVYVVKNKTATTL